MVEVTISGCCQFQGTEADVVQCFIINAVALVGVFNELMDR